MNIYTVCFFGHRELVYMSEIEEKLEKLIYNLITQKEYVEFLVGRDGEFDQLVSSTVRRIKKKLDYGNSSLVLVLPYMKAEYRNNKESFLEYYDEIEVCEKSARVHFKKAIQVRNRCMADRSDLIVCCIQKEYGGAYEAVKYAKIKNYNVINIAEESRLLI